MKILRIIIVIFSIFSSFSSFGSIAEFDDHFYENQWNLNGSGFVGGGDFDIGFEKFIDAGIQEDSENITVIIGAGIYTDHEDIRNSLWVNQGEIPLNNIDDDLNGYIDDVNGVNVTTEITRLVDYNGVGTAMASIIAAERNNEIGLVGMSTKTKVVYCQVYDQEYLLKIEYIERCADYILHLKNDKQLNIASVVLSFSVKEEYPYFRQLMKPAFERLQNADILVVAPLPKTGSYVLGSNVDISPDYPSSYLMPNVISVAGLQSNGGHIAWGENSVMAVAPGSNIMVASSLSQKNIVGESLVHYEQNSVPAENMVNVEVSMDEFSTGNESWKFTYDQEDAIIEFPPVDLTEYKDQLVTLNFDYINNNIGVFEIDYYNKEHEQWESLYYGGDVSKVWNTFSHEFGFAESKHSSLDEFRVRIIIGQDSYVDREQPPIYIDNFKLADSSMTIESDKYITAYGNAMAAAQVAASIAIIKSSEELENWQIRNLVIASGLEFPLAATDIEKRSISNKILQLYGQENNGILNCENQVVHKRLHPAPEAWIPVVLGHDFVIKGISLNCGQNNGPLTVYDALTDKVYTSLDDGTGHDSIANDGMNITTIQFEQVGKHKIEIDSNPNLIVYALHPYQMFKETTTIWKDQSEFEYGTGSLPFNLKLGGLEEGISGGHETFLEDIGELIFSSAIYDVADKIAVKNTNLTRNKSPGEKKLSIETNVAPSSEEELDPYNPDFVPNGITHPWKSKFFFYPYNKTNLSNPADQFMPFAEKSRVYGEEGDRMYVYESFVDESIPEQYRADFTAQFQMIFFEKNSTFVYSYKNFSQNLIDKIIKRGVKIGENYELVIEGPFENDVSYVFKENDGTNSTPEMINSIIEVRLSQEEPFELKTLFSDADNDVLFFKSNLEHPLFSIDRFGTLKSDIIDEETPGAEIAFELEVSDVESSITAAVTIKILPKWNNPPTIELEEIRLKTSEFIELNINQYVQDVEGDDVNVNIANLIAGLQLENGILKGRLLKSDYPLVNDSLEIELSDGENLDTHQINLHLEYQNHAPIIKQHISDIQIDVNNTMDMFLLDYFEDIDLDTLSFTIESTIAELVIGDGNVPILRISGTNSGDYTVNISIDDNDGGTLSYSVNVKLFEEYIPPVVEPDSASSGGGSLGFLTLFLLILIGLIKFNLDKILFYRVTLAYRN